MKKIINTIIRIIVMIGVLVITIFFVNKFENRGYENLAIEMEDATLPLAYVKYDGEYINCMHGYTSAVDCVMLRDSITPIDENKNVVIAVDDKDNFVKSYAYELRSIAGDSLIENGELEVASEENGFQVLNINIRMDIAPEMEYMLVIKMNGENDVIARYYTRVVINADYHAAELLEFVDTFYNATYDFEAEEEQSFITPYRETYLASHKNTETLTSLGHINLGSAYTDLTWGELTPMCITSLVPTIKEIDVNYAVIELDYKAINIFGEDQISYYLVKEYYRVSYGEDGISLMDFDRYVDEYFNRREIDSVNNVYEIGIVSDDDMMYRYSTDNKKISFVRNGQLWLYDYRNNQITMAFGFWMDDVENFRNTYDKYDINIISMDDDGNMYFAVYGYINRGVHEGKLGIELYYFEADNLEIEELLFVENNVPYDVMKRELSRLTYFDGENFYFMLGDKVNCIQVADKQMSYYVDTVTMEDVYVSDNMEVMAYCSSEVQQENKTIHLVNLKTGSSYELTAGQGNCLICYGFKDSDFIYGECKISDTEIDLQKTTFDAANPDADALDRIPAEKLCIVDENGVMLKEYEKEGYYIADVRIDTDLIYLTRAEKRGQQFVMATDDFITYKEDEENPVVGTTYRNSAEGCRKLFFTVPSDIYLTYIPRLTITKNQVKDKPVTMVVEIMNTSAKYMVYDNLGLAAIYEVAGDAINAAVNVSGIVISQNGEVIYRKSESLEYNTIASAIFHYSSGTVEQSLQDCIYMTLIYQGMSLEYQEMEEDLDAVTALTEYGKYQGMDISGLSLELVFGYISDGIPVISRIDDGRYVLIVSYNSEYIRYYDPVIGDEVRTTRAEYENSMEKWNSELYTYIVD